MVFNSCCGSILFPFDAFMWSRRRRVLLGDGRTPPAAPAKADCARTGGWQRPAAGLRPSTRGPVPMEAMVTGLLENQHCRCQHRFSSTHILVCVWKYWVAASIGSQNFSFRRMPADSWSWSLRMLILPILSSIMVIIRLPITYGVLPVASYLFPVAYCPLSVAYYLMSIAYCLLPVADCSWY